MKAITVRWRQRPLWHSVLAAIPPVKLAQWHDVTGPTRHVMSGCVGSPTNGSENGRMAIGHGGASIGPSWAPCEVSAELSIVGAASGGSDVRVRRELIKASSELSKARYAYSSPSDSGGKA